MLLKTSSQLQMFDSLAGAEETLGEDLQLFLSSRKKEDVFYRRNNETLHQKYFSIRRTIIRSNRRHFHRASVYSMHFFTALFIDLLFFCYLFRPLRSETMVTFLSTLNLEILYWSWRKFLLLSGCIFGSDFVVKLFHILLNVLARACSRWRAVNWLNCFILHHSGWYRPGAYLHTT